MGDACVALQLFDGVSGSLGRVRIVEGDMVRAGVLYSRVCFVGFSYRFTVPLEGVVE